MKLQHFKLEFIIIVSKLIPFVELANFVVRPLCDAFGARDALINIARFQHPTLVKSDLWKFCNMLIFNNLMDLPIFGNNEIQF